jgi:signal transduction histidine kinase
VLVPLRLEALFSQVAETWKNVTAQAKLDFRVEMPEPDLVVLADAPGVRRILSILLDNAYKYTPRGGVITLRAVAAGGRAEVSVRDSGVGIDPAYKERVFERFFRAPTNGALSSGSGLGLSLAKSIAERHGTQLWLESSPGLGSCFSFSLERAPTVLKTIHDSPIASGSGSNLPVPSLPGLLHEPVAK